MGISTSAETRTDETQRGRPVELRLWFISGRRILLRLCLMATFGFVGLLLSAHSASAAEGKQPAEAPGIGNTGSNQPPKPQQADVAQGRLSPSGGDEDKESTKPIANGLSEVGGASPRPRPQLPAPAASNAVDPEPIDVPVADTQSPVTDAAAQSGGPVQMNGSAHQEQAAPAIAPAPADLRLESASQGPSMAVQTQADQGNAAQRPAQRLEPVIDTAQHRLDEASQQFDATRNFVERLLRSASEEAESTTHQVLQLLDFRSTGNERPTSPTPSSVRTGQAVMTPASTTGHLLPSHHHLLRVAVRHLAGMPGERTSPSSARWVAFEPAAPSTALSPIRPGDGSAPVLPIGTCLSASGSTAPALTWSLLATDTSILCVHTPTQAPMRANLGAPTRLGAAPDSTPD